MVLILRAMSSDWEGEPPGLLTTTATHAGFSPNEAPKAFSNHLSVLSKFIVRRDGDGLDPEGGEMTPLSFMTFTKCSLLCFPSIHHLANRDTFDVFIVINRISYSKVSWYFANVSTQVHIPNVMLFSLDED